MKVDYFMWLGWGIQALNSYPQFTSTSFRIFPRCIIFHVNVFEFTIKQNFLKFGPNNSPKRYPLIKEEKILPTILSLKLPIHMNIVKALRQTDLKELV